MATNLTLPLIEGRTLQGVVDEHRSQTLPFTGYSLGGETYSPTNTVLLDITGMTMGVARFKNPEAPTQVTSSNGRGMVAFETGQTGTAQVWNPTEGFVRPVGAPINNISSPQARYFEWVVQATITARDEHDRRNEKDLCDLLKYGGYAMVGEGLATKAVNFNRSALNAIAFHSGAVLPTGNLNGTTEQQRVAHLSRMLRNYTPRANTEAWFDSAGEINPSISTGKSSGSSGSFGFKVVSPMSDIQEIVRHFRGTAARTIIMGTKVFEALQQDPLFVRDETLSAYRGSQGNLTTQKMLTSNAAMTFHGTLRNGISLYVYTGGYHSPANLADLAVKPVGASADPANETQYLDDYEMVILGDDKSCRQNYGIVLDAWAGYGQHKVFYRNYIKNDPGRHFLMSQSALVLTTTRTNSTGFMSVRALN